MQYQPQSHHPMSAKARAIVAIKSEIATDLIVDYIIDHLIERNVFTEEEKSDILSRGLHLGPVDDLKVRSDILKIQSEYFLDLLVHKMNDKRFDFAYNHFFYILFKDGNYPWIGDRIVKQIAEIDKLDELMVIPGPSPEHIAQPIAHNSELDAQPSQPIGPQEDANNNTTTTLSANNQNLSENVISLTDIAGYEKQIKELKDLIEMPLKKGSLLKKMSIPWPKTVLIYGPMGTGKSSVCKALCTEFSTRMYCLYVNCGTILTKNVDQTKTNLNSLSENAIQKSPSLVFLDNCEVICSKAKLGTGLVTFFGCLLDNLPQDKHIVVILVTNRLELIDDSIRKSGRIDREIKFTYPNAKDRFEIMKKSLKEDNCDVRDHQLKRFVSHSDLKTFSGADLRLICKEANWNAVTSDRTKITLEDLNVGLEAVNNTAKRRHSVNVADLFVHENDSLSRRRSLTFVRSSSAGDWPRPDPIVFERLNEASDPQANQRLVLYGPPGSYNALMDEAEARDSQLSCLTIDLSPDSDDKIETQRVTAFGDGLDLNFIDD